MSNIIWSPQQKQLEFMSRPEDEALYGGAAGGGKSDALVIEATRQIEIPHYKGLILRKTYPQLTELIEKSLKYYPQAFPNARYNASEHTWKFPSGAKIVFGSMQHSKDKLNYQGKAYDFIGFDELTHFTYEEYIYLMSRNRANGPGTRVYTRSTANPGGIGHAWVKDRFITPAPPLTTMWESVVVEHNGKKEKRHRSRIFVPSSVFDNSVLLKNDPDYLTRLAALPEAEQRALLYGDWDSYSGQYFAEWRDNPEHYNDRRWTHVIEPFDIPSHWKIHRSFDWGYNKPFSCGWWAVDTDGIAYRILELYGCTKTANEGLKWTAKQVFSEIRKIEEQHEWLKGKNIIGVADPAIFASNGGESIAETAQSCRVYFSPGDNNRIPGWQQVRNRLAFDENGYPMLYVFKNCKAFIRTVPALIYDDHKVEDVDTDGEDHIGDDLRYFCMSRPIKPRVKALSDNFAQNPMNIFLDIKREDLKSSLARPRMEIIKEE